MKILNVLLLILGLAPLAHAQIAPCNQDGYCGILFSGNVVVTQTPTIDLTTYMGSRASGQVTFSTSAFANLSFLDGSQSTDSIKIVSFAGIASSTGTLTVGTTTFIAMKDFQAVTSNNQTATNLATAINAASAILGLKAQAIANVVTTTSTLNGSQYNYVMVSSTQNSMTVAFNPMVNGTNPQDTLGSSFFQQSASIANIYPLALPVSYGYGNSVLVGGLTQGTTYYLVPFNSGFYLAKYSTSAVAGLASDFIVVSSTNSQLITSENTYTLNPLAISGSPTIGWQSSDDKINWTNTIYSTSTALPGQLGINTSSASVTTWFYDFGQFNYRYLRLNLVGPSAGAVNVNAPVRIKQDGIGRF